VDTGSYLLENAIEFITLAGNLQPVAYAEAKAVCFVADTATSDLFLTDKSFERRPKLAGLWTRFWFRDGDQLEGVLPHNLLEWPHAGFIIVPPKAGASRQRVFVPRLALSGTELRGVVGTASSRPRKQSTLAAEGVQLSIFDQ